MKRNIKKEKIYLEHLINKIKNLFRNAEIAIDMEADFSDGIRVINQT